MYMGRDIHCEYGADRSRPRSQRGGGKGTDTGLDQSCLQLPSLSHPKMWGGGESKTTDRLAITIMSLDCRNAHLLIGLFKRRRFPKGRVQTPLRNLPLIQTESFLETITKMDLIETCFFPSDIIAAVRMGYGHCPGDHFTLPIARSMPTTSLCLR